MLDFLLLQQSSQQDDLSFRLQPTKLLWTADRPTIKYLPATSVIRGRAEYRLMEELANTLAAIDSGARSLSMRISDFTEAWDHSCILSDGGRPEAALLLQRSNVLVAESKRRKDSNIVTG